MMVDFFASGSRALRLVPAFYMILVFTTAQPLIAGPVAVGQGSYTTTLPAGGLVPSDEGSNPVQPLVTDSLGGPAPSTDWWSSLIFPFRAGSVYSNVLAAQPLNLKAEPGGLGVGTGAQVPTSPFYYAFGYQEDILVGLTGMNADATEVDGFGDWTVTASWEDPSQQLLATFGHGLPFIYFEKIDGTMQLHFATGLPHVWYNQAGTLGITVNNKHYGVFAPTGSTWELGSTDFRSALAGHSYMSMACLPDASPTTLALFREHAFAFVTDSRVTWQYDESAALLTTDYDTDIEVKEGSETRPLLGLYRHQYLHTDADLLDLHFPSMKGDIRLLAAAGFQTTMTCPGILPQLPARLELSPGHDPDQLDNYLDGFLSQSYYQLFYRPDTYYGGKDLGIVSSAIRVADQVGRHDVRDYLLNGLKQKLEDWLSADPGERDGVFYYNDTWGALYGYPASFGTDRELTDHHFHWSYFIMAASVIAMHDEEWAAQENWGGMINMLIRDADSWERDDPLFPFLRCFDPYSGHSWASGHADFGDGNNQESSSEAMQFAAATALWGSLTGQAEIRNLGVYLYTTELAAIEQYWFDVDGAVFPPSFAHNCVGMVWGTKATHETWFSAQPEMIHGINFLPITPASLYLGRHPQYVQANYDEMVSENGGQPDDWVDIMWEYLALADPQSALSHFDANPHYQPEGGESRAHTFYWLHAMASLGQLDPSVTADVVHYAVFNSGDAVSYVYYNPDNAPRVIHFSDGRTITAPARKAGVFRTTDDLSPAAATPEPVRLAGAFPNPFNPHTTLAFELPHPMTVSLNVYDASGRLVRSLLTDEVRGAGVNEVVWNGRNTEGLGSSSGVYFYRLEAGAEIFTGRMTLLK